MAAEERQYPQLRIPDPSLLLVVFIVTAIEEHVLFARVAMHVTVECDFTFPA